MSSQSLRFGSAADNLKGFAYERLIDDICELDWISLTQEDLINVAWVYYYFSVQFRECLRDRPQSLS